MTVEREEYMQKNYICRKALKWWVGNTNKK
jgi:hypothetical protein